MPVTEARVLLLPGWQDSDAEHWQSRWQRRFGFERVQQDDWWWPRRGDWMMRLEESLLADDRPAVLVAHSLGCALVSAWAAHSQHTARVAGALLVAPPDIARADMPPQLQAWTPLPAPRLPFAALAVVSDDDPYAGPQHGPALAAAWGAGLHRAGAAGHLNSASGLGDWPAGQALLAGLLRGAGLGVPAGLGAGN
ncbi:MAG: serine hydrolase family protein [Burkholderiaceae bacterium]|nr:serine hydrolase family protein [Burkholderiaceae bacterium]